MNSASGSRRTARDVAAAIGEHIDAGILSSGEALPTVRELAETYGVSVTTAHKALDVLTDEGRIVRRRNARPRVRDIGTAPTPVEDLATVYDDLSAVVSQLLRVTAQVGEIHLDTARAAVGPSRRGAVKTSPSPVEQLATRRDDLAGIPTQLAAVATQMAAILGYVDTVSVRLAASAAPRRGRPAAEKQQQP
ncbi:winged helix-turn-helix domain-containing protein [Nocardia sp. NPDC049220]|uniref:winged helix-turn-helix domain-containing protein n=1 Tax=Nocardia sp. NPDC049220 TaxID=3155273 RepID=UPI00340BC810